MPIRDIVFLPLFLAMLPVCFIQPFFGILVWMAMSLLNPHRFTWGSASTFPVAFAVTIPTLAGVLLFSRRWSRFLSRDVFLIVVLWAWFAFTTVHNTRQPEFVHFAPDTWFRFRFVSKILLMTLVTIQIVNTWSKFRWLLLVLSGSLAVLVLKAIPFMILTGGSSRLRGPDGTMLADNNDLGLALNMTLPMFFFLAKTEPKRRVRWIFAFLTILTVPTILFTYSRGAFIGLAVVLFVMVITSRQRLLLIPIPILVAIVAIFLAPESWQHRMDFRQEGALWDSSALSRINAWKYSWNLAVDHPLTGGGFEAFTPPLFMRYAPDPLGVYGPHSIYFGVLAEHGFVGLFLYLSLLLSCFWTLQTVMRYSRAWASSELANYASMLRYSLVGFMVAGAFLGRAYFDYFFTVVACTAILKRLCRLEAAGMIPAPFVSEDQTARLEGAGEDAESGVAAIVHA